MYLIDDLKVKRKSGVWIQPTDFPLTCSTSSYFLQAEVKINVSMFSALPGKTLNLPELKQMSHLHFLTHRDLWRSGRHMGRLLQKSLSLLKSEITI